MASGQRLVDLTEAQRLRAASAFVSNYYGSLASSQNFTLGAVSAMSPSTVLPALIFEDWTTGATDMAPMTALPNVNVSVYPGVWASQTCTSQFICHCGPRNCSPPVGFRPVTPALVLPNLTAPSAAAPQGANGQLSSTVNIVFGIRTTLDTTLLTATNSWSFDTKFQAASPWAQRAMLAMCQNLPSSITILEKHCWIQDFRAWLLAKGSSFPVDRFGNFNNEVQLFLATNPSAASYIWLDSQKQVIATAFSFKVPQASDSNSVMNNHGTWQQYVDSQNSAADSTANAAWPTCKDWVYAEAYILTLSSSWQVFCWSMLVITLAGIAIMWDIEMLVIIGVLIFVICTFIWFFMLAPFRWDFGPWELTILTVYMCFSVEPAFHIGQEFVFPDEDRLGEDSQSPGVPAILQGTATIDETPLIDGTGSLAVEGRANSTTGAAIQPSQMVKSNARAQDGSSTVQNTELSERSSVANTAALSPQESLTRSVDVALGPLVSGSIKLFLCGIFLLACHYRIFVRLGALAMLVPLLALPSIVLFMPLGILMSGRMRREPDLKLFSRVFLDKASWLWS